MTKESWEEEFEMKWEEFNSLPEWKSYVSQLLSKAKAESREEGKAYWEPSEHHKNVWRAEGRKEVTTSLETKEAFEEYEAQRNHIRAEETERIRKLIKESLWYCTSHIPMLETGCADCSQALEVNVVLSDILSKLTEEREGRYTWNDDIANQAKKVGEIFEQEGKFTEERETDAK